VPTEIWDKYGQREQTRREHLVELQMVYPRQNGLAIALRKLGRIEHTLFILDWLQSVELRRRVNAGLNKGEARNALVRAVFFYRLGEGIVASSSSAIGPVVSTW
jgi:TnpA family transposase